MATKKEKEAAEKAAQEAEEQAQEDAALQMLLEASAKEPVDNRLIALFGDIDEAKAGQLCYNLFHLAADKRYAAKNPEDLTEGLEEVVDPIQLMICSPGGNASEMFAIYDCMRLVRDSCPIETLGVGKVMSAGVLVLAAGTKGKRRIGKNCRVMIHSVIAGNHAQQSHVHYENRVVCNTTYRIQQKTFVDGYLVSYIFNGLTYTTRTAFRPYGDTLKLRVNHSVQQ